MFTQLQLKSHHDLQAELSENWTIQYVDLGHENYDIDGENKILFINCFGLAFHNAMMSPYFRPQVELSLIEGLRMARHCEWLEDVITTLRPEQLLLMHRICEADIQTQKILAAWSERMNDYPVLWKYILCGDTSDIAQAFIKGLETLLSAGVNEEEATNKALAMAFNSWFSCAERVRSCDHRVLNMMDVMIDSGDQFGDLSLKATDVGFLTLKHGDKKPYLDKGFYKDLLKNPYYSSIDDDINQAHLNQIICDTSVTRLGYLGFQDSNLAKRFTVIK